MQQEKISLAPDKISSPASRKNAPVFVIGCGRSGTTLLYHMLLSAGNFVVYRTESNVINLLEPRFGDLSIPRRQRALLDAWYGCRLGSLSGLKRSELEERIRAECKNGGDFLRIIMEEMARKQGVERWADTTPEHLLYLERIKETIPDALIIHIIRDGRDVALSTERQNYIRRLPWDRTPATMVAGLYWEWMVNRGRRDGQKLGHDYTEVHFEDLIERPQETLARLGDFIEHDLDYERILQVGIGSVRSPNTSFRDQSAEHFSPIGRWRAQYSDHDLHMLEALIGKTLVDLGYELAKDRDSNHRLNLGRMRTIYRTYFDAKLYLKAKTPLARLLVTRDLSWI